MCINEANINRQFKLTHSNQKTNHPANLSENYENHYVRIQIHSHKIWLFYRILLKIPVNINRITIKINQK